MTIPNQNWDMIPLEFPQLELETCPPWPVLPPPFGKTEPTDSDGFSEDAVTVVKNSGRRSEDEEDETKVGMEYPIGQGATGMSESEDAEG